MQCFGRSANEKGKDKFSPNFNDLPLSKPLFSSLLTDDRITADTVLSRGTSGGNINSETEYADCPQTPLFNIEKAITKEPHPESSPQTEPSKWKGSIFGEDFVAGRRQ